MSAAQEEAHLAPLSDDLARASGLESLYADGQIYKTKSGVHPEEDWGELKFSCARMD